MKSSVPATAKISKEAKECVQECVSEFISFITSEAAEKCQMEKRKTIGGEDILYAMLTLGFENYAETLKIHLAKLRQVRLWPSLCVRWDALTCHREAPAPDKLCGELETGHGEQRPARRLDAAGSSRTNVSTTCAYIVLHPR